MNRSKLSTQYANCPVDAGQLLNEIMIDLKTKPCGIWEKRACKQDDGSCWRVWVERISPEDFDKI